MKKKSPIEYVTSVFIDNINYPGQIKQKCRIESLSFLTQLAQCMLYYIADKSIEVGEKPIGNEELNKIMKKANIGNATKSSNVVYIYDDNKEKNSSKKGRNKKK